MTPPVLNVLTPFPKSLYSSRKCQPVGVPYYNIGTVQNILLHYMVWVTVIFQTINVTNREIIERLKK